MKVKKKTKQHIEKKGFKEKRYLLTINLKPFAFGEVRGKHYTIKEFQRLAGREKKLLVQRSLQLVGMVAENSCNLLE